MDPSVNFTVASSFALFINNLNSIIGIVNNSTPYQLFYYYSQNLYNSKFLIKLNFTDLAIIPPY